MKDDLNIEELFKEKFNSFEGEVSPNAWTNIQQGMNAANVAAAAGAKTGMSLFVKAVIFTGGMTAATIGGILFFSDDEGNTANDTIVENVQPQTENRLKDLSESTSNDVLVDEQGRSDVAENNSIDNTVTIAGSQEINETSQAENSIQSNGSDNQVVSDQRSQENDAVVIANDSKPEQTVVENQDDALIDNTVASDNVEQAPEVDVDYPTGSMSFTAGDKYAPSTYKFEANAKNFTSVRWDFGDGTIGEGENISHTFQKPGSYSIRLTVFGDGQVYEESQTISIKAKSGIDNISNVITPNGDRINDFFIVNSHNIETFYIVIKDKNGTIVFETTDPAFKWYGIDLGGNSLDVGMYFYDIYAKGTDGSEFKIPGEIRIE